MKGPDISLTLETHIISEAAGKISFQEVAEDMLTEKTQKESIQLSLDRIKNT